MGYSSTIFFFYGLVFFSAGISAIFIRLINKTKYDIFNKFSFLGGFFIFKAIAQWEHLFFPLFFYQLKPELFIINLGHRLLSAISDLFLLAFAFEIFILLYRKLTYLRGIFILISISFFIYVFIYPADTLYRDIIKWSVTIENTASRFISLPAGILASIGLYIYSKKTALPRNALLSMRVFAVSLLFYVLHVGIFVFDIDHVSAKNIPNTFYELSGFKIEYVEMSLAVILLSSMVTSWFFTNNEEKKHNLEIHDGFLLSSEHERIAHDLHDGVIQSLFGLSMKLNYINNKIVDDATEDIVYVKENLTLAQEQLVCSVNDIRDYIYNNIAEKYQYEDIAKGIESIIYEFKKIAPVIINFEYHNISEVVPDKNILINIYFIAKESIMNVIKHSAATEAKIILVLKPNSLFYSIKDNGKGLAGKNTGGVGLASMAERTKKLKGSFEIIEDHGLLLEFNIPLGVEKYVI
jgi:signal transduction histidine kinase